MQRSVNLTLSIALGFMGLIGGAVVSPPTADAAQVYICQCKGERTRFLASSRYCERQTKVARCSQSQYRKVYTKACIARGCRLP